MDAWQRLVEASPPEERAVVQRLINLLVKQYRLASPAQLARQEPELPAGEPVMILERRTFTLDDALVEYAHGVHAASRFAWTYSFKIPD